MSKKPNPIAKALQNNLFRKKVVQSKKTYDRKKVAGKRHSGDYFLEVRLDADVKPFLF